MRFPKNCGAKHTLDGCVQLRVRLRRQHLNALDVEIAGQLHRGTGFVERKQSNSCHTRRKIYVEKLFDEPENEKSHADGLQDVDCGKNAGAVFARGVAKFKSVLFKNKNRPSSLNVSVHRCCFRFHSKFDPF